MPSSWGGVLVAYAPDASPPRLAWFVTVLVTVALRHPLKNGMEAGGIELTLDHRKPFAGCAVTRYGSDFIEFDSRLVPPRSAAVR